ncbi:MAG: MbnP family copper-binding protein [Sandaracinaceae bacterium]
MTRAFRSLPLLASGLLLSTALGACGATSTDVAIGFEGLIGGEAAACGVAYDGIGATGSTLTLADYRLYVSDVRLLTDDGTEAPVALTQDGEWQLEDIALLDFEDGGAGCPTGTPDTRTVVEGTVAESGPFTGIRFVLGVPFDRNHDDVSVAPTPMNLTAMFWNWQGGYKFLRVDGTTTGLPDGFRVHLGSTGCDGDPVMGGTTSCANPNRPEVTLSGFDPTEQRIRVDIAGVLATTDIDQDGGGQPGCMSGPQDPECPAVFERLGLPFGGNPAGTQQLFSGP